jgi:hypothetical protein
MAKMPEAMQIVPGDECLKYLLLSNSHTGEGSVTVKFKSRNQQPRRSATIAAGESAS